MRALDRGQSAGRSGVAAALAGCLLALAAPPAPASSLESWAGRFETGGELAFRLARDHGERRVRAWRWSAFPVLCDGASYETAGKYLFALDVKHREFSGRAVLRRRNGEVIGGARVDGEFDRGYGAATGTFRVYGRIPEGVKDCESTKVPWTATPKVAPP